MKIKNKEYYTSREAAQLLHVAVSTIQDWTNKGILDAWTTAGGHRRISRLSVDKLLKKTKPGQGFPPAKKISVLLVEDDSQQIRMYKKFAGHLEHHVEVTFAENGYQGMLEIGKNFPDIIITDLLMPKMDGFEFIRALNDVAELDDCLIVVVTGVADEEIEQKGYLPERVLRYRKPFSFDEFESLVKRKNESKVA